MKTADFLEFIRNGDNAVFTTNDVVKITGKGAKYVRVYLHRLKRQGRIHEIERGKFALLDHPFSVASSIIFPAYLSFFSGLSYYDLTTQMPRTIYVAAMKSKKTIRLKEFEIKFIRMKKERFFGYKKEKYQGKTVFVASIEKAILDCLLIPEYCPLDETISALKASIKDKRADTERLLKHALKMNSSVLLKRLGLMLEHLGYDYHDRLKKRLTAKFDMLDPLGAKTQKKNSKWMLYVNEDIV